MTLPVECPPLDVGKWALEENGGRVLSSRRRKVGTRREGWSSAQFSTSESGHSTRTVVECPVLDVGKWALEENGGRVLTSRRGDVARSGAGVLGDEAGDGLVRVGMVADLFLGQPHPRLELVPNLRVGRVVGVV